MGDWGTSFALLVIQLSARQLDERFKDATVCSTGLDEFDMFAFKCKTCVKGAQSLNKLEAGCVELDDGSKFELVEKFCYLGDMLCAGGGAEEASRTRVRSAWGKFNELAPVLTKRGVSLKLKGKIYDACVQRVLVYGSENLGYKSGGPG